MVVMPGGWAESLPKWIHEAITMERLIEEMKAIKTGYHTATDAEVVAYLFTAGLVAPLNYEFTNIYVYLVRKVMDNHKPFGNDLNFPKDMIIKELTNYEQHELDQIKKDIYNRRISGRRGTHYGPKTDDEAEQKAKLPTATQPGFDLGDTEE